MISNDFNVLESTILEWLKTAYDNQDLVVQVNRAKFITREWTKVGYFVHFEVPKDTNAINPKDFGSGWPIPGPGIESKDVEYGGEALIWGTDGYIDCIEMYAYGNFFKQQVGEFALITYDGENNIAH